MNVMKTSLTIILMCPRERLPLYKSLSKLVLCYKKDWAILLHLIYFYYLLLVTNYLITKLSVTDNFSACREYLTENCLSFPSATRWVLHSYLSKRQLLTPYTCGSSRLFSGAVARETSLREGEIIAIVITTDPLIERGSISINIFTSTISSQTLVHLLYSILVSKPQIGTCGLLVVLITPCS